MQITHLRIYKPDGEILEFERGQDTQEGAIYQIRLISEDGIPMHPFIRYEIQKGKNAAVEAHFIGFPYSYRRE